MNHALFKLFIEYNDKPVLYEKIEELIKQEIRDAVGHSKAQSYEFLCKLSNSINNAGWQDRHSEQIDIIHKEMHYISDNWEEFLP